jgi:hypothetical protein
MRIYRLPNSNLVLVKFIYDFFQGIIDKMVHLFRPTVRKFAIYIGLSVRNTGIKIAIILLISLAGCDSKPDNLLSEKEMSTLIVELKLLESKVDHFFLRSTDSTKVAYRYLQNKVFKEHNTDSTAFYESYEYYLNKKKKMLNILNAAGEKIEAAEKMDPKVETAQ